MKLVTPVDRKYGRILLLLPLLMNIAVFASSRLHCRKVDGSWSMIVTRWPTCLRLINSRASLASNVQLRREYTANNFHINAPADISTVKSLCRRFILLTRGRKQPAENVVMMRNAWVSILVGHSILKNGTAIIYRHPKQMTT